MRQLAEDDVEAADRIMRVAFGTFRGLPDPSMSHGDAEYVRTRFRAAPECAWVAEVDGAVVGSVFATRWGTFGFFGPLTVDPECWGCGVGSSLMEPVLDAFDRWGVRQAGLFTFPSSAKHLGLYQKHGFWPQFLTVVMAKPAVDTAGAYTLFSEVPGSQRAGLLEGVRGLTNAVFSGLDLEREILTTDAQRLGDTILLHHGTEVVGLALCHCGAGSEAGSGACYVKFGAVRPATSAAETFEQLLDACEALAAGSGLERVVEGVNTGRLDAYRRLIDRGFRAELIGVSMRLHPGLPDFDTPERYVLDDLR